MPSGSSRTTAPPRVRGNTDPWLAPGTSIPGSVACAAAPGIWTGRPCGAPIPRAPVWSRCSVRSSPNPTRSPASTRPGHVPRVACLSAWSSASWRRPSAGRLPGRGTPELGQSSGHPRKAAVFHRDLPAEGRSHPACVQGYLRRTTTGGNLSGSWCQPGSRVCPEDGRLWTHGIIRGRSVLLYEYVLPSI